MQLIFVCKVWRQKSLSNYKCAQKIVNLLSIQNWISTDFSNKIRRNFPVVWSSWIRKFIFDSFFFNLARFKKQFCIKGFLKLSLENNILKFFLKIPKNNMESYRQHFWETQKSRTFLGFLSRVVCFNLHNNFFHNCQIFY